MKVDLVFLVDNSAAINQQGSQNWGYILQFMVEIVDNLPISPDNARVGVVLVSQGAVSRFYLNTYTTRDQVSQ